MTRLLGMMMLLLVGNEIEDLSEKEVKMVWIVTYWDFDQEPVVTPFNNRENAEKCWAYFKEIHDGCCLDECEVFSKFLTPNEFIGEITNHREIYKHYDE